MWQAWGHLLIVYIGILACHRTLCDDDIDDGYSSIEPFYTTCIPFSLSPSPLSISLSLPSCRWWRSIILYCGQKKAFGPCVKHDVHAVPHYFLHSHYLFMAIGLIMLFYAWILWIKSGKQSAWFRRCLHTLLFGLHQTAENIIMYFMELDRNAAAYLLMLNNGE